MPEGDVHSRLNDAADANLKMHGKRFEALVSRLRQFAVKLDPSKPPLECVETEVTGFARDIKPRPETHELITLARMQSDISSDLHNDLLDINAQLDRVFRTMARRSEVQAARGEIARLRNEHLDFELRLLAVETRLGVTRYL